MDRIIGAVRRYHWGDTTWIPRMLGQEPDGEPVAELWFGTHASAECRLPSGATLADAVRDDPVGALGRAEADGLTFLAKVLAAAEPLSIQLHPDADQAREGFAREEAAGIPIDAPDRIYRDDQPKPELVCAITPFSAKCGLRPPEQTVELLDVLGAHGLGPLRWILDGSGPPTERLREAVEWLLELDEATRGPLVDEVVETAARTDGSGPYGTELGWTARLAAIHPGDVGVLVALLLNHVHLQPGQALFLSAGQLHSYLEGMAVEVMTPSDNVIRGGLTSKHVDPDELLRLLDPSPLTPQVQDPPGPVQTYQVGGDAFALQRIDLDTVGSVEITGPGVLLATTGSAEVSSRGDELALGRGDAVFIRADDGPTTLSGAGVVHHASA